MRRFAAETEVPVSKSRAEIDELLTGWGCKSMSWSNDMEHGRVLLQFVFCQYTGAGKDRVEIGRYLARIPLVLKTEEELRKLARHETQGHFLQTKFDRLQQNAGRREHRVLLLWLKGALNAVEDGLVSADALFLPFLVGGDGQTVAEAILPRLRELNQGSATRLLGAPKGAIDAEFVR